MVVAAVLVLAGCEAGADEPRAASVGVSAEGSSSGETASSSSSGNESPTSSGTTVGPEPTLPATVDGECSTTIVDPVLAAAVWDALELPEGSVIPSEELAGLTDLWVESLGVSRLDGLECALGLRGFSLGADVLGEANINTVEDLSPLSQLPLERVYLNGLPIEDLSSLGDVPNLEVLDISDTNITDLSPLAGHPALEALYAKSSAVSDLTPLTSCPALRIIGVEDSEVSDISPVSGLPSLQNLRISRTHVSDLSPLVGSNVGVLFADGLQISEVPDELSMRSIHLAENGITDIGAVLTWTNPDTINLSDNAIEDVSPLLDAAWLRTGGCRDLRLNGNPLGPSQQPVFDELCARQVAVAADDYYCISPDCVPSR